MLKNILKNSWHIAWRNPILWIFGFFSTILTGNEISFIVNNFQNLSRGLISASNNSTLAQVVGFNLTSTPLHWWGFLVIVIFFLILLFLVVFAQIGLILGTKQQINGDKPKIKEISKKVGHYFAPAFLINLTALILVYIVFMLIRVALTNLFLDTNFLLLKALYFLINLIILIPASLIIYFLARFAVIDLVLTNNPFNVSLKRSWTFFFKNWLLIIALVVVLGLIGFGFGLILFILSSTTAAPFIILTGLAAFLKINISFPLVLAIILFFIGIVFVFLEAFFFAFQNINWILFYLGKKSE
jgi:hypothetical protein